MTNSHTTFLFRYDSVIQLFHDSSFENMSDRYMEKGRWKEAKGLGNISKFGQPEIVEIASSILIPWTEWKLLHT